MADRNETITSQVDPRRVATLAQSIVRIPSPRWEETHLAEFVGMFLFGLGFDVSLPVLERHGFRTKQVVATWPGRGSGPTLLLHSHMDTGSGQYQGLVFRPERWTRDPLGGEIEDGWLYGLGTQNNKNGVATCCMTAEALVRSGVPLNGTLKIVFVAAHSPGGVGITQLLKDGLTADAAIVVEGTGQDVVTIESGVFRGTITVRGAYAHHDKYVDPIAQASHVIEAFGPPYESQRDGAWLTFESYQSLAGYPRAAIRKIESDLDTCTLLFDILAVPSMTQDTVAADLRRMLERIAKTDPSFKAEIGFDRWMGPYIENNFYGALEQPQDSPIVHALVKAHRAVMGRDPIVGLGSRDAAASDAQILRRHGIPAIQYGPGSLKDLGGVWPAVDERIRIADIVSCAKTMAVGVANFLS